MRVLPGAAARRALIRKVFMSWLVIRSQAGAHTQGIRELACEQKVGFRK